MSVFLDILNLLTVSPGGMVYYLVLLFSIWAMVGLALSRWSREERHGFVARLLVASAIMSFARLLFFVLALVDRQSGMYLVRLGPPLERLIDTVSLILICWAFVIRPQQRTASQVFLGVALFLAGGLYAIAAIQWWSVVPNDSSAIYNLSWQPWAWEIGQLALAVVAIGYLFLVPVRERGTLIVCLGVLALGHLLQAVWPFEDQIPHFASWVRFANLMAYPLLAVVAFRIVVQQFDAERASLSIASRDSLAQLTGLMDLLEINEKISASLDLDTVLANAIRSSSQALQASLCALAFVSSQEEGELQLPIVYNAPQISRDRPPFRVERYPVLEHVLIRGKPLVLGSEDRTRAKEVYQLLGSEQEGPAIVQPLGDQEAPSGLLIACRPGQSRPFTAVEVRKCETLAARVSAALENALQYRHAEASAAQQAAQLQNLETDYARTRADLENRLKQSQEEVSFYVQKLYESEVNEQRAQNDALQARQELMHAKQESQATVFQIKQELQKSAERMALLTQQLAKLDAARSDLTKSLQALQQERQKLSSQLEVSEVARSTVEQRLQAQLQRGAVQSELDVSILDNIGCGVICCDPHGEITYTNQIAARLLNYEAERWLAETAFSLCEDSSWQAALHSVTDQYSGDIAPAEPFVVNLQGLELQVDVRALQTAERHVGAIITLHDLQIAKERTLARDEFLSSIAQELRTPMTSIVGYTDLLMNESVGQLEDIQRKFLQRVQANVERMEGMLNDIIGVTAIDSGKLVLELGPVDMVRVIESALRKVQFRLEEKELNTRLRIGELPVIHADPECVQQILDNLLTNACKSSEVGTTIGIEAYAEVDDLGGSHLHIAVSDTGGGIASEDRSRVFERFYRADNALIAGLGETGVGLAIVKALVEAHRGHVWVESEMGAGTTFHFTLPYNLRETIGDKSKMPVSIPRQSAGGDGHG